MGHRKLIEQYNIKSSEVVKTVLIEQRRLPSSSIITDASSEESVQLLFWLAPKSGLLTTSSGMFSRIGTGFFFFPLFFDFFFLVASIAKAISHSISSSIYSKYSPKHYSNIIKYNYNNLQINNNRDYIKDIRFQKLHIR